MTLWLFGDSFAAEYWTQDPDFPHYYATLADRLKTGYEQYGVGGTSAEYTYQQFHKHKHKIRANDTLVFALTTPTRRWFFPDKPMLTSFWSFKTKAEDFTPQEANAFEQYMLHLDHQLLFDLAMKNFLYTLDLFALKQNVTVIVMPCFPDVAELASKLDLEHIKLAKGTLWKVNDDEFADDFRDDIELIINDGKPNHLTATNHKRLTEKLLATIQHDEPLDLTTGFVKGTYTKDSIQDANYRLNELGGVNTKIKYKFK